MGQRKFGTAVAALVQKFLDGPVAQKRSDPQNLGGALLRGIGAVGERSALGHGKHEKHGCPGQGFLRGGGGARQCCACDLFGNGIAQAAAHQASQIVGRRGSGFLVGLLEAMAKGKAGHGRGGLGVESAFAEPMAMGTACDQSALRCGFGPSWGRIAKKARFEALSDDAVGQVAIAGVRAAQIGIMGGKRRKGLRVFFARGFERVGLHVSAGRI